MKVLFRPPGPEHWHFLGPREQQRGYGLAYYSGRRLPQEGHGLLAALAGVIAPPLAQLAATAGRQFLKKAISASKKRKRKVARKKLI